MTSRPYKGPTTAPRYDGSEVFENLTPGTIAQNQTYPAFERRNWRILEGEWVNLSYFQKIASGRRCSCWGNNTSPSGKCRICYKTGIVGGWNKLGTKSWILDPTTADMKLTGIQLVPTEQEGPMVFELADEATYGEIVVTGDFEGCWGPLDLFESLHWAGDGEIHHYIKTPAQTAWIVLTEANLESLLSTPQRFDIKITMRRPNVNVPEPPLVSKLLIRIHRTSDDTTLVKANRPRGTHALALTELGTLEEWTTLRHWFDSTLSNITSDDWFWERQNDIRWKAVDVERFAPQNYLLSTDVTLRKVQDFEPISAFPI